MQTILDLGTQILTALCCLLILIRAEPALNRMGQLSPPFLMRVAFALLATGAVAGILSLLAGKIPDRHTLLILAGTAALTFCERRVRILTGNHRKGHPHA